MTNLSRTQTILRNVVSNWLGYAVQAAVVFFLTPFVLRELGDARYGVWTLITSITGTYGLLAFGLQGGVNQYLTRYLASRDFGKMNAVASTATAVLSLVGLAILAVSLVVAWLFPYMFEVPSELAREVRLCTVIVAISVAVQMGLFVFSSAFMATQRYDLSNLIGVATRLLSAGMVFGALKWDYGLVGVGVATFASNLVDYLIRWKLAYRIIPELTVSRSLVTAPAFREMFHYGAWSFLGTLAQSANANATSIIIGLSLPIAAMTPYALALGLIRQLESALAPIIMVFFPAATELHTRADALALQRLYIRASRLFLLMVVVASIIASVWAKDFYQLWVGDKYISGKEYPSVAVLFQILLAGLVCRMLPGIGSQILLGTLKVRTLTLIYFAEAVVNVLLTAVLIEHVGLLGAALAMPVAALLCRTFVVPWAVGRSIQLPNTTFMLGAWVRPLVTAVVFAIVAITIRSVQIPNDFSDLAVQGSLAVAFGCLCVVVLGMTGDDRKQFIYQPLRTIATGIGVLRTGDCPSGNPQSRSEP